MNLKRVDSERPVQGDKRQFFPFELQFECPGCGGEHTRAFYEPSRYLMNPEWGEEAEVELFCEEVNTGEPVKTVSVVPNVTLELSE